MKDIQKIYCTLLKYYGKQGWWPVTPSCGAGIKPVYGVATRTEKQRFEIIIGSILAQNTNWKNVEKAITNLSKEDLIDIKKLKNIKKEILADLIKPSGYYNQKAERLKLVVEFFDKNFNDFLKSNDLLLSRKKLLEIKGIGPETADSILLYAFEKPIFVIDAYTRRIMHRL